MKYIRPVAVFFLFLLWGGFLGTGFCAEAGTPDPSKVSEAKQLLLEMQEKSISDDIKLKRLGKMVAIPEGEFLMGSDSKADEGPVRRIYLDRFYMDQYEVTQFQYMSVMGKNPSFFRKCDLCPVEKVTYKQADEYCRKMNKRLPTEAEWEKAARAGTSTHYYWGDNWHNFYSWNGNNSDQAAHPVGQMEPNGFGLHDMAGNVAEWVSDWYDADYYKSGPKKNPKGPATGSLKVVRGGSWGHPPEFIRHANREMKDPQTRHLNVGFRCVSDSPVE